jgi:hypothetical protein
MTEFNKKDPGRTLYDKSRYKPKVSILKIVFVIFFVLALLLAVCFLDHMLWWNAAKWELKSSRTGRSEDFLFLGFSNYEKAQKKLSEFTGTHINDKTVVSYFDLTHRNVFIINNRGTKSFLNVGIMSVYPESGITTLLFHPSEIVETRRENFSTKALYYGTSLFPQLFDATAKRISKGEEGKGIGFIFNPINDTKYLKIPYMIYFFLPLLIIILLSANYRRFAISFFYYGGLFLLFDFKRVLFIAPFSWLINLLGVNISHTAAAIISALMLTVFITTGFMGIVYKHKREPVENTGYFLPFWGRGLIVFFLLLPLVLRF